VGFTLAGWAGGASAAPGVKQGKTRAEPLGRKLCPLFRAFDRNHDGRLDRSEAEALRLRVFVQADVNGDGKITRGELTRSVDGLLLERVHVRFAQLDRNRDGRIVRDEVGRMDAARFQRFDGDGNGQITEGELGRAMLKFVSARVGRFLAHLDADRDGKLSFGEVRLTDERVAHADSPER
jgi:Ca2+-binding EF-hand superfamily protein